MFMIRGHVYNKFLNIPYKVIAWTLIFVFSMYPLMDIIKVWFKANMIKVYIFDQKSKWIESPIYMTQQNVQF